MGDEAVGLLEGAFVEKEINPLAGRHFAFFVLALAAFQPAAVFRQTIAEFQFLKFLFEIHGGDYKTVVGCSSSVVGKSSKGRIPNETSNVKSPAPSTTLTGQALSLQRTQRQGRGTLESF